jgi:hypothetical protein
VLGLCGTSVTSHFVFIHRRDAVAKVLPEHIPWCFRGVVSRKLVLLPVCRPFSQSAGEAGRLLNAHNCKIGPCSQIGTDIRADKSETNQVIEVRIEIG